jgi:alpha-tubulin suppressor-like RCC1 family protein
MGQLKKTPAPKFKSISVGGKHPCAIGEAGDVYCWGENAADQCGYDHLKAPGWEDVPVPLQVAGVTGGMIAVSLGDEHTQALRDDGSVYAWGDNTYGELGNGMKGPSSFTPVKVNLTSVKQIAAGDEHVCVAKGDGSVWCWGYGGSGALGTGDTKDLTQPQRVTSAQLVFSGGNAFHTCGITVNQELQCWGQNSSGEVGTGQISEGLTTSINTPTIGILPTVTMVALAKAATCAVTTDQVLWCWGQNKRGQLANPESSSGTPYPVPQRAKFSCP